MRRRLLLLVLLTTGCRTTPPVARPGYYGPTEPLPDVVEKLNARNARIDGLWGGGDFSADLIDPNTAKHTRGDGDLVLMYAPPGNLRLVAKVLTDKVFEAGANASDYWLILPHDKVMYTGTRRSAAAGSSARLPVRPDLLAEVLGVTPMDPDLLHEPAPVLRFDNEQDSYVLSFQSSRPGYWATEKEVWYDRRTLLPRRVWLFDDAGRVVLRAELSDPEPVDGYDPPVTVPARYDLVFAETGSTFSIRLKTLARRQNGVPNARTFVLPTAERAGVPHRESLDR